MNTELFHSKGFVYIVILLLILLIANESLPGMIMDIDEETTPVVRVKKAGEPISAEQRQQFDRLMTEGKDLLQNEMNYQGAIQIFSEALQYAVSTEQKSEVYLYVSLAYYAQSSGEENKELIDAMEKLISLDYHRLLDQSLCPPSYIEIYNNIKSRYGSLRILSQPPGADVYINSKKASSGKTPLTIGHKPGKVKIRVQQGRKKKEDTVMVVAAEETTTDVFVLTKKSSSTLLIIGGIAVVGAIVAVLALSGDTPKDGPIGSTTGNLEVKSNPTGARIWLNNVDTGQNTNYTFTGKNTGTYEVKLVKENYSDYQTSITVGADQTVTVDANLNTHTITVKKPDSNTIWDKTKTADIEWSVDGSSKSQISIKMNPLPRTTFSHNLTNNSLLKRNAIRFRSTALSRDRRAGKDVSEQGIYKPFKATRLSERRNIKGITDMNESKQIVKTENIRLNNRNIPPKIKKPFHYPPTQTSNSSRIVSPLTLSNVKIQLYKGNTLRKTIVENTGSSGSSGSYQWQEVDPSLPDGTDYKIRVLSATDANVYGESDNFEIGVGDFDEHFDNATNVNKFWKTTNFSTLWTVTGGVYKKTGKGQNQRTASYYNLGDYSDFTFEAKCGNESATNVWYGLAIRGSENFSSYYFFYVGEGLYQIKKYDNGTETALTTQRSHNAINTGANHWNRLKVKANGKTFTFYINDSQVGNPITINDAPDKGRIGLVTRANYENVKFDDISVQVNR